VKFLRNIKATVT